MSLPVIQERRYAGWFAILTAIVAVVIGWSLCRRGIVMSDEGYLLTQALDMLSGKVLYRDLDAFVTPGVWFLHAGIFSLFEPSVIVTRFATFAGWITMLIAAASIVRRCADLPHAIAAVAALVGVTVWQFPAWSFSFYSPYSMTLAILALERVLAWQQSRRARDAVLIGLLLGASIMFKQNYGALAALGCALAMWLVAIPTSGSGPRAFACLLRATPALTLGGLLAAAPFAAYFIWHGSVWHAIESLVIKPYTGFVGHHSIPYLSFTEFWWPRETLGRGRLTYGSYVFNATPFPIAWPWPAVVLAAKLHIGLYWLPALALIASGTSFVTGRSENSEERMRFAAVVGFAAFMFLGVFPRADLNHLLNVYQPVVIAGAIAAFRMRRAPGTVAAGTGRRVLTRSLWAVAAAYALVTALFTVDLVRSLDTPLVQRRGGVLVNRWEAPMIGAQIERIQSILSEGEHLLTMPGLSMLNFLSERPMPGRFYNLYAVHIAHDKGSEVAEAVEKLNTKLVVTEFYDFFSDDTRLRDYASSLVGYLKRNFEPTAVVSVDRRMFLERRATPRPERNVLEFADRCKWLHMYRRPALRTQLLSNALYHKVRPYDENNTQTISSACTVDIPADAELAVSIGHRAPQSVADGTRTTIEIWLDVETMPDTCGSLVFRHVMPIRTFQDWITPAPKEYRVDLSDYAYPAVSIALRSITEGSFETSPFDIEGMAITWTDPRLEWRVE